MVKKIVIVDCRSKGVRYLPQYELFLASELEEKTVSCPKIITIFPSTNFYRILEKLAQADLILLWEFFSTKSYSYLSLYFEIARFLKKKNLSTPLVFGGYWATTHGRYFKEFKVFDYILEGFSFEKITDILANFSGSKGRFFDARGRVDWNKYDLNLKYLDNKYSYFSDCTLWGYLTSFGCPLNCKFCYANALRNYQTDFSARSVEKVKKDIDLFLSEYKNMRGISIKDLNFFYNKERAFEILRYINSKGIQVNINLDATVKDMDETFFKRLQSLGINKHIYFGLESFTDETRKRVGKFYTSAELENVFRLAEKYNVDLTGNVILGFPWQTKEMIVEEIKRALFYIDKFKNVYIMMNVYKPEYGTDLQQMYFKDLHQRISFPQLIEVYKNRVRKLQKTVYGKNFDYIDFERVFNCLRVIAHLKRYMQRLESKVSKYPFIYLIYVFKTQLTKEPFFRNKLIKFILKREVTDLFIIYFLKTLYRSMKLMEKILKIFIRTND